MDAKPVYTGTYEPYVPEGRRPEPLVLQEPQYDVIGARRPRPRLPDPGRTETGHVACNAEHPDFPGLFCQRLVKVYADGSRKPHRRRKHRFEWSD